MDDIRIRRDIERLNLQRYEEQQRWEKSQCLKPRAKSEYSYLDKIHCVQPLQWTMEHQAIANECHDSGVSIPLAISQASNLQYEGEQCMIDRSFGFLDQEVYSNINGIRPPIFNCKSEPAIAPNLNMDQLSQVRPGYLEDNTRPASIHDTRPASIHVSCQYNDNVLFNDHMMYHSMDTMYQRSDHTSTVDQAKVSDPLITPAEQHVVIDRDAKRGFGFTIRTATNISTRDRVKIKEVKADSPAAMKGLIEGQVLLHVNGNDIQQLTFEQIVDLIHKEGNQVKLTVISPVNSTTNPRPSDILHEGYLQRQIKCGGIKIWCKQWVSVKRDGCLYYYRSKESQEPNGMIVLPSFRYSKAVQANKKHVVRITRGSSVYLFAAQDVEDYEKWVQVLAEASKTQTFLLQSSIHSCALAALAIESPMMTGYLIKLKLSGFRAKRKYCVLKDQVLLFYHDIQDKKAHEVICLTGYTCAPTSVRNYKYCFALIPPSLKRCTSVVVYANESKFSYERWCERIKQVLDNTEPVQTEAPHTTHPAPTTHTATHPAPTTHTITHPAPTAHTITHPAPTAHTPSLTRSSNELCETKENREYYRKKEIKNGSMCNFNTLVHTEDEARPRSWHLE